jgi:ParB-like chromosome segregation protein Spo0J
MVHIHFNYTALQYNAFMAQVQKDGRIIIPIIKSRRTGNTVDGKTRERAAKELGFECPKIWMDFNSDEEEREFEMRQQALRRNLTDMQWCYSVDQVLAFRGLARHTHHGR